MNVWKVALTSITLALSANVNAVIISSDWQLAGDNLITQDTDSGLEWLDLTVTSNMSYNDVSAQLGAGGDYEGWRYATRVEIASLWDAFGGDSTFYYGLSSHNNGLFDLMAPYIGDLYCLSNGCSTGEGESWFITGDYFLNYTNQVYVSVANDRATHSFSLTEDLLDLNRNAYSLDYTFEYAGSALVREISTVPVPAAVWLFGSGLIGLVGMARRKKA